MSSRSADIAVAGGGIAGLTAALAFARKGFSVLVLERSPVLHEAGAGLQLSPNATRILDRLGVLEALAGEAMRPDAVKLKSAATLKLITRMPLGEAAQKRWRAPYLVAHRADLQATLLKHVADTDNIRLLTDTTATNVQSEGGRVRVSFEHDEMRESVECRLAVGADGVWSRLRGLVREEKHAASRFTGYLAWRAMVGESDRSKHPAVEPASVTTFLSPRFHLVAYPLGGGQVTNLVAVTKGRPLAERWTVWPSTGALEAATAKAAPALRSIIETAGPWTAWPIHTVDAEPAWTSPVRGLALIGDAAHAMTPFAAQGAAMAIEDAAVLAEFAAQSPQDIKAVLARYEAARRPRVKRVVARGAFNGFVWHAGGLFALGRNALLRLRPAAHLAGDFDWLYGWDAGIT